jgi:ribonuclease BN (tRNA processing enzyme)
MIVNVIGYYGGSAPKNEATSSYLLEFENEKILLDCGAATGSVIQNYCELTDINHIILSHYHWDHFSDIGVFIYNRYVENLIGETDKKLNIYSLDNEFFIQDFEKFPTNNIIKIDESCNLNIAGLDIRFYKTKHPIDCLAIRCEYNGKSLVYTADVGLDDGLIEFSKGADLLITECSLYEGVDGSVSGHMNINNVIDLINESAAKKVILSHLPIYGDFNENYLMAKDKTKAEIFIAKKFLKMKV